MEILDTKWIRSKYELKQMIIKIKYEEKKHSIKISNLEDIDLIIHNLIDNQEKKQIVILELKKWFLFNKSECEKAQKNKIKINKILSK